MENIPLADGADQIKTVVVKDGKNYEDTIEWIYTGEKKRETDMSVSREEHAGF